MTETTPHVVHRENGPQKALLADTQQASCCHERSSCALLAGLAAAAKIISVSSAATLSRHSFSSAAAPQVMGRHQAFRLSWALPICASGSAVVTDQMRTSVHVWQRKLPCDTTIHVRKTVQA